ncbi:MAG TPA: DUF6458 family protein [Gaiellaceae bacterium]|nr:DUF6458 family protein [Gaiellaceae bacterium]
MGIAVSLIITAAGFILALAVHPSNPGSVNVNTVGWILVVVGIVAFLLDMLLWSEWGPGYMRRTTYVEGGPAPVRRRYAYPRRRTVVEEETTPPAGPPPGY